MRLCRTESTILLRVKGTFFPQVLLLKKDATTYFRALKPYHGDGYELYFVMLMLFVNIPTIIIKLLIFSLLIHNGIVFTYFCLQLSELNDIY
jgi:hypothetical protein